MIEEISSTVVIQSIIAVHVSFPQMLHVLLSAIGLSGEALLIGSRACP